MLPTPLPGHRSLGSILNFARAATWDGLKLTGGELKVEGDFNFGKYAYLLNGYLPDGNNAATVFMLIQAPY